ncbi:hypothetical protein PG989_002156 [Apiospora arundinis]
MGYALDALASTSDATTSSPWVAVSPNDASSARTLTLTGSPLKVEVVRALAVARLGVERDGHLDGRARQEVAVAHGVEDEVDALRGAVGDGHGVRGGGDVAAADAAGVVVGDGGLEHAAEVRAAGA